MEKSFPKQAYNKLMTKISSNQNITVGVPLVGTQLSARQILKKIFPQPRRGAPPTQRQTGIKKNEPNTFLILKTKCLLGYSGQPQGIAPTFVVHK